MGEFRLKLLGWDRERRFAVVRERLQERKSSLGRKLFEVPGYTFRIFVTNLEDQPEEIWRDYNMTARDETYRLKLLDCPSQSVVINDKQHDSGDIAGVIPIQFSPHETKRIQIKKA